jgi:hypothetical protein
MTARGRSVTERVSCKRRGSRTVRLSAHAEARWEQYFLCSKPVRDRVFHAGSRGSRTRWEQNKLGSSPDRDRVFHAGSRGS